MKKQDSLRTVCTLILSLALSGFAQAKDKSRAEVTFTSEPSGAEVHVQKYNKKNKRKKGQSCVTPCTLELKLDRVTTFRVEHEGYAKGKVSFDLRSEKNGVGYISMKSPGMEISLKENGAFHADLHTEEEKQIYVKEMEAKNAAHRKAHRKRMRERQKLEGRAKDTGAVAQRAECIDVPDPSPDRNAVPLVRVPPVVPPAAIDAGKSGQCMMRFNVNAAGRTVDIEAISCTDPMFAENSKRSVRKWYFNPKLKDGERVSYCAVETKIRYILRGDRGEPLPE